MGLWIDKSAPRIEDLERIDQNVSQVATVEGLDVAAVIGQAQEEVASELKLFLERATGIPEPSLADVAVTERLRRWTSLAALSLLYRNAYFNQMSERYAAKWKNYVDQADRARRENFDAGVGRISKPVSRPATPSLTMVTGSMEAGAYFICVSATNSEGAEGEASETATLTTSAPTGIRISFGSGTNVAGWNVYAGTTADGMTLQGGCPVAPGEAWQSTGNISSDGKAPGNGQSLDYVTKVLNRILRG
ncbi:MAG: hypothetical protein HY820_10970 [Acidobacteria bacterium]|nr:hypothetical protein [Acidobacteriota bacterium]